MVGSFSWPSIKVNGRIIEFESNYSSIRVVMVGAANKIFAFPAVHKVQCRISGRETNERQM